MRKIGMSVRKIHGYIKSRKMLGANQENRNTNGTQTTEKCPVLLGTTDV